MTPTRVLWCALWTTVTVAAAVSLRAAEPPRSADQRLVVMTDGRILEGSVVRQASGYHVEKPGGRILVPFEQVRCIAKDLVDAYRQQREAMLEPTAADLIRLADWCLTYRLYDEARDELKRALRRDPENDTARRMLSRLEETLASKPPVVKPPLLVSDGLVVPEVEALGGLSRPLAARFTERVQPLLMNKCGGATCHGSASQNEFRLTAVRLETRNHRRVSEQNLAQVLKFIDVAKPYQSPLLEMTRGAHGGAPLAIFAGPQAAEQQKLLRGWVEAVAQQRRTEDERLARQPRLSKQPAVVTASAIVDDVSTTVQTANAIDDAEMDGDAGILSRSPPPKNPSKWGGDAPFAPPVKGGAGRVPPRGDDPFDPEEFNRKFGGGTPIPR
jgi:hypothetical protein